MALLAGVDEAGRGPVIGPLVVAGVSLRSERLGELRAMGVKDSKLLKPAKRAKLGQELSRLAEAVVAYEIEPKEIDEAVGRMGPYRGLNHLEAVYMAKVIVGLAPEVAYVDASDVDAERFRAMIVEALPADLKGIRIIAEHHADRLYPIVGAASIIAKVRRDERIREYKGLYGEVGSGYPTDPRTIAFLREWLERHGTLPPIVRKSWSTVKRSERGPGTCGPGF